MSARGASGGVIGNNSGLVDAAILEAHPALAQQIVTVGRRPRVGHDRARWEGIDWDAYRARVGVDQIQGPWTIEACQINQVDRWVAEAEHLPPPLGEVYTALLHRDRGTVMSDVPGEIAGALPFLDYVDACGRQRVLIAGLGLGIVPAWLLAHADPERIDVVEIDADVIQLILRDRHEPYAPNAWAADPRLHIHLADAHTWTPQGRTGCWLHPHCMLLRAMAWDAAFYDIWDTVSDRNLPSMHRLHRHYSRRVFRAWSWERAECEAMRRRGRHCRVSEIDY